MPLYSYNGPVMEFDRVVANNWKASTIAPTEKKARNNLSYRYKRENGKSPAAKVSLPGKIQMIEGDES